MLFYFLIKCFILTINFKIEKIDSENNLDNKKLLIYQRYCKFLFDTYNKIFNEDIYSENYKNQTKKNLKKLFDKFNKNDRFKNRNKKIIIKYGIFSFKYLIDNINSYKNIFLFDSENNTIKNDFNYILNFFYYEICKCKENKCIHYKEKLTYIFVLRLLFNDIIKCYITCWYDKIDFNIVKNILKNNNNFVYHYYNIIIFNTRNISLNLTNTNHLEFLKSFLELFINHITKHNIIFNYENSIIYNSIILKFILLKFEIYKYLKTYSNDAKYIKISLCCKVIFIMLNIVQNLSKKKLIVFFNKLNYLFSYCCNDIGIKLDIKKINHFYFKIEIVLFLFKNYIVFNNNFYIRNYSLELLYYLTFTLFRIYCLSLEFVKTKEYSIINVKNLIKKYFDIIDENYYNGIFLLITNYPLNYLICLEYLSVFYTNNNDNNTNVDYMKTLTYLIYEFLKTLNSTKILSYNSIINLLNIFDDYFNTSNNLFNFIFNDKQVIKNNLDIVNYIFLQLQQPTFLKVKHGYLYIIFYIQFLKMYENNKNKFSFIKKRNIENYKYIITNEIACLVSIMQNNLVFVFNIEFNFFVKFVVKNFELLNCFEFSYILDVCLYLIYNKHAEYKYSNTIYFNNKNRIKIIKSNKTLLRFIERNDDIKKKVDFIISDNTQNLKQDKNNLTKDLINEFEKFYDNKYGVSQKKQKITNDMDEINFVEEYILNN